MNILILAAGPPVEDPAAGPYPLWLSEVGGRLAIEEQVDALRRLDNARFVFTFRRNDIEAFHLTEIVENLAPGSGVIEIRRETSGAACTALLAIGEIDMDAELIVANATDHLQVDFPALIAEFRRRGADAGILTFESLHPRYSFARADAEGWVSEVAEKRPISRLANAGFYWFAKAQSFFDCARQMILKDAQVNGKFYLSPALNEMILKQQKVLALPLEPDQYVPLKAPHHVELFEQSLRGH
jgi:hypothetical protein